MVTIQFMYAGSACCKYLPMTYFTVIDSSLKIERHKTKVVVYHNQDKNINVQLLDYTCYRIAGLSNYF